MLESRETRKGYLTLLLIEKSSDIIPCFRAPGRTRSTSKKVLLLCSSIQLSLISNNQVLNNCIGIYWRER